MDGGRFPVLPPAALVQEIEAVRRQRRRWDLRLKQYQSPWPWTPGVGWHDVWKLITTWWCRPWSPGVMSMDQIKTIVSTLARSVGSGVIRRLPLLLMVLRMLPVPSHSAPCSHAIVVGDWLICTLMDWMLLRIFFWWPARVTPILSKSLCEAELNCDKIFWKQKFSISLMEWIISVWSHYTRANIHHVIIS